jgi:hypothetical protein
MRENSTIQTLKLWVFPTLVSILAMMIWNDVNEIKADVKALMAQSNIDKTRIDNLERQVYKNSTSIPISDLPKEPAMLTHYAVLPNNELLKKQKYEKVLF